LSDVNGSDVIWGEGAWLFEKKLGQDRREM